MVIPTMFPVDKKRSSRQKNILKNVFIPWYPISYLTIAGYGIFWGRLRVPTQCCDLVVPADWEWGRSNKLMGLRQVALIISPHPFPPWRKHHPSRFLPRPPRRSPPRAARRSAGKKRAESYSTYIYKVLSPQAGPPRQRHQQERDEHHDSFINDIFECIAGEAGKLSTYNKKATHLSREIQTAVRLMLTRELAKHAVSEGTKAVTKFSSV